MNKVPNLASTFVTVGPDLAADTIEVTETVWADIDEMYGDFKGRTLVSSFEFSEAWPTWEMHPAGDELCYLRAKIKDDDRVVYHHRWKTI